MRRETTPLRDTIEARFGKCLQIAETFGAEYLELRDMSEGMWLTIGKKQFANLEKILWGLYRDTKNIVHKRDARNHPPERISALTADLKGLSRHIFIMNGMSDIFWTSPSFRGLFPFGTTLEFVKSENYLHDLNRFGGINAVSIAGADLASHELGQRIFPGYPHQYLHDIGVNLGLRKIPDITTFPNPTILKAFDTFSKEPFTSEEDMLNEGGALSQWVRDQVRKKTLSDTVPDKHGVTAQIYEKNDREYTQVSLDLIRSMVPDINFFDALEEVIYNLHR